MKATDTTQSVKKKSFTLKSGQVFNSRLHFKHTTFARVYDVIFIYSYMLG